MNLRIAPSILAVWESSGGDVSAVVKAAKQAVQGGADMLHVDVMDGIYVPATTFGPEVVSALQGVAELDVHLMVDRPEQVVRQYMAAGADRIVFHPSASDDVEGTLRTIASMGVVGGLALDVHEDPHWLEPHLDLLQAEPLLVRQVLVMTVKAGAGGQPFRHDMLEKIATVRRMVGPQVEVVVDGGVTPQTAPLCKAAGASCLVAGSAIFKAPNIPAAISALR